MIQWLTVWLAFCEGTRKCWSVAVPSRTRTVRYRTQQPAKLFLAAPGNPEGGGDGGANQWHAALAGCPKSHV